MMNRARMRTHVLTAASVLGLACGVLGMTAAPAGAATAHTRPASAPARPASAPMRTAAAPENGSVKPAACSPLDYPIRFSASTTWTSPWLVKSANGCQSVWATSGQTFYYEVVNESYQILGEGWCYAGTTCQLWNPATNNVPFYIYDFSQVATSVNIYY
jgi:hypothetical protein